MVLLPDELGSLESSPPTQPPRSRKPVAFILENGRFKTLLRESGADTVNSTARSSRGSLGPSQSSGSDTLTDHSTWESNSPSQTGPLLILPRRSTSGANGSSSSSTSAPAATVLPAPSVSDVLVRRPAIWQADRPAARQAGRQERYCEMTLPCGLRQEELIDIMYRELTPEDFETLCKLDEQVPRRDVVRQNLVEQLPQVRAADCGVTNCGVCLEELEPQAWVVKLPCRHAFHPKCITRWLTQCKNTCPFCSAPIRKPSGITASFSS